METESGIAISRIIPVNPGYSHQIRRCVCYLIPRPLAGGLGFEPRQAESESAVLPLDDPPSGISAGFSGWARLEQGKVDGPGFASVRPLSAPFTERSRGETAARRK